MFVANQPALPPGAPSDGRGQEWCARVLFNLQQFIFSLIDSIWTLLPPKQWHHTSTTLTLPSHTTSPYSYLLWIAFFGWLLHVGLPIGGQFTSACILFLLFLRCSIWCPRWWDSVSPRDPPPVRHLFRIHSTANTNTRLVDVFSF